MTAEPLPPAVTPSTPRYIRLYQRRVVRTGRGRLRHLFRSEGIGLTSVCKDAMFTAAAVDNPAAADCPECRMLALTDVALTLLDLGLRAEAIAVAGHAGTASFETRAGQTA